MGYDHQKKEISKKTKASDVHSERSRGRPGVRGGADDDKTKNLTVIRTGWRSKKSGTSRSQGKRTVGEGPEF